MTMKASVLAVVGCAAMLLAAGSAHAALIEVTFGDLAGPSVLDFETAATGSIGETSPVFTDFGFTSVSLLGASDFTDAYGVRANSSRALWANSSGLAIVDPGETALANMHTYSIVFESPQMQFGFGTHDQSDPSQGNYVRATTFSGAANVGTIELGTGISSADLNMFYIENDQNFNRIEIQSLGASGFAIDNLTLATPEPGSVGLTALGLLGGWFVWRRRFRTANRRT